MLACIGAFNKSFYLLQYTNFLQRNWVQKHDHSKSALNPYGYITSSLNISNFKAAFLNAQERFMVTVLSSVKCMRVEKGNRVFYWQRKLRGNSDSTVAHSVVEFLLNRKDVLKKKEIPSNSMGILLNWYYLSFYASLPFSLFTGKHMLVLSCHVRQLKED